jgi:pimeloyl-ACP methyl ester carboxylesterase
MYPAGIDTIRTRRVTLPSGITLRVAESGRADAPPVVLLHGWGASIYMWREWFEPLAAAGFRAVAVDLPGHGLSDKPEVDGAYTLEHQVRVVRELFGAERLRDARTVAQSMAGTIALELALASDSPVGRLALVNPAALGRVHLQPLARLVSPRVIDRALRGMPPRWVVARAHRLAYADGSRVTPRDVDEYWAPSRDPGYAPAMRRLLHEFRWRREPAAALAGRMRLLTHAPLVVLGGRDRLVRGAAPYAAALRSAGARLELLELEGAGHAVNEEEPGRVLPRVLEHLR